MDKGNYPIEGFTRRPKRPSPNPIIILPEIIEISDEEYGGEQSVPPKINLESVVKREAEIILISDEECGGEPSVPRDMKLESVVKRKANEIESTDSEIVIPYDIIDAGKKRSRCPKEEK